MAYFNKSILNNNSNISGNHIKPFIKSPVIKNFLSFIGFLDKSNNNVEYFNNNNLNTGITDVSTIITTESSTKKEEYDSAIDELTQKSDIILIPNILNIKLYLIYLGKIEKNIPYPSGNYWILTDIYTIDPTNTVFPLLTSEIIENSILSAIENYLDALNNIIDDLNNFSNGEYSDLIESMNSFINTSMGTYMNSSINISYSAENKAFSITRTSNVNNSTTQPAFNNSTTQPVFNNSTTQPAFNNSTTQPAFNNSTTQPAFNNSTTQPAFNNSTTQPVFNNSTTQPVFNNSSTQPVFNNSTTQPAFNNSTTQPAFNNSTTQPVYIVLDDTNFIEACQAYCDKYKYD